MTADSADPVIASARVLVAYVGEEDGSDPVTRAAVDAARGGARLILYDRDAASFLSDPLPNQWASQGEGELYGDPLSDAELVKLGREELARKVAAARAEGVDAWGALPRKHGMDELVDYARDHAADLLLLPADLDDPSMADRLKGETAGDAVDAAEETDRGIAVLLVNPDGSTRLLAGRL